MKTTLDAKSLIIGLLAGAALFATFGAMPQPANTNPQIGRYQVSSGSVGASFVVDTITGQVWSTEFSAPKLK